LKNLRTINKKKILLGVFLVALGWLYGSNAIRQESFPYFHVMLLRDLISGEYRERLRFLQELKSDTIKNSASFRRTIAQSMLIPNEKVTLQRKFISKNSMAIISSYYGIKTKGVLTRSKGESSCLLIYANGHHEGLYDTYFLRTKNMALKEGCDVLRLSMLGMGTNLGQVTFPTRSGRVMLTAQESMNHDLYASYFDKDYPDLSPISLFITGNHAIVDSLDESYDSIYMVGLSGGGWMTTLLAALMPDIDASIAFAGSLPIEFREHPEDIGDYEQTEDPFWRSNDYWQLYILGMLDDYSELSRRVFLIYAYNDSCCFRGTTARRFKEVVDRLGDVEVLLRYEVEANPSTHSIDESLVRQLLFKE
jgi:hypothetical protein